MVKSFLKNNYFPLVLCACSCFYFFLFYKQSLGIDYPSDLREHITFAMDAVHQPSKAYSLLHKLLVCLAWLFSFTPVDATFLFSMLMVSMLVLSVIAAILVVYFFLKEKYPHANILHIQCISISLLTLSMMIPTSLAGNVYLGIGTPNPWHNATYLFCKPFSLLTFIYFTKLLTNPQKNNAISDYLFLSVFGILSMWAKPSFMLIFLPAVAIVSSIALARRQMHWKRFIGIGLVLLPSFIPLYFIHSNVYLQADDAKIIFTNGEVWRHFYKNIPIALLLAAAFPMYVILLRLRHLSYPLLLAFLVWITGCCVFYFIAEDGYRFYHGNFSWSYLFGLMILFFVTSDEFFFQKNIRGNYFNIGLLLFAAHVLSGLVYFTRLLLGYGYQ